MNAAGAYLRVMREAKGYSRAEMAERLGSTETNLWRIEEDGQEPKAGLLLGFINEVRGSAADFYRLLLDTVASEDTGRKAAQLRLSKGEMDQIEQLRATFGDDALADAVAILAADPSLIEALGKIGSAFGGRRKP